MRLAPVCIYYADTLDQAVYYAALSSKTTHGSPIAVESCRYFAYIVVHLLNGVDKDMIFSDRFKSGLYRYFDKEPLHRELDSIVKGDFMTKREDEIRSTGYVIHSLEASLWSFYHTDTFEDAILKSVNLGDDADTVGAITGQLVGAFYGSGGIPGEWVGCLSKLELIKSIQDKLMNL